MLDGAGSRRAHGVQGGVAIRQRPAVRPGGERRKISRRRGRLQSLPDRDHDPRRLRLRQGISRRALFPRKPDPAHRAGDAAPYSLLHRREGFGAAQVLLEQVLLEQVALEEVALGGTGLAYHAISKEAAMAFEFGLYTFGDLM